jgi:hypothetical protein
MRAAALASLVATLAMAGGTGAAAETCNRDLSETLKWVRATGKPETLPGGMVAGLGLANADLTVTMVSHTRDADRTRHGLAVDPNNPETIIAVVQFEGRGMLAWRIRPDGTEILRAKNSGLTSDHFQDRVADELKLFTDLRCGQ